MEEHDTHQQAQGDTVEIQSQVRGAQIKYAAAKLMAQSNTELRTNVNPIVLYNGFEMDTPQSKTLYAVKSLSQLHLQPGRGSQWNLPSLHLVRLYMPW